MEVIMSGELTSLRVFPEMTVRELVLQYPQLRAVLEKLNIDYCCGGLHPLAKAAGKAGLEWSQVLEALESGWAAAASTQLSVNWDKKPLPELADHILAVHHSFTRTQLQRLEPLLTKVARAHADHHGKMLAELRRVFDALAAELMPHLEKEEKVLFPAIKQVVVIAEGDSGCTACQHLALEAPIRQMMLEHDNAGQCLAEWRSLTGNYQLPEDACMTFAALFEAMQELEADLHEHIHLENNILFPKSLKLAGTLPK
jgi:regulator of cell morphogenesis and NO signaling